MNLSARVVVWGARLRLLAFSGKKQTNVTKYQVKYKAKGTKTWKTKNVTKNSVALKSLKKNTKYQIKVRAFCSNGWDTIEQRVANWSEWSEAKTFKTAKK